MLNAPVSLRARGAEALILVCVVATGAKPDESSAMLMSKSVLLSDSGKVAESDLTHERAPLTKTISLPGSGGKLAMAGCLVATASCRSSMSFASGSSAVFRLAAVTSEVDERV